MNLLKKSLAVESGSAAVAWGHLLLRVTAGLMSFYIHGWHKLEGWIAYLQHGTSWKLAEEVAGMHFPAPVASALAATLVQSLSSLFVVVGCLTRINSALLVGVRSTTGDSLHTHRPDPRLDEGWQILARRAGAIANHPLGL